MADGSVTLNEVVNAFKNLAGKARPKQIEDYIVKSRGDILPKTYGTFESYRNTISQVIHIYCPGYAKYRGKPVFEKIKEDRGFIWLIGFNECEHHKIVESGLIDTFEIASTTKISKTEFDKIIEANKKIGVEGELRVMEYERERLRSLGRTDLANQIRHIALDSVSEGYDIISFDQLGNRMFIEVKTSLAENNSFYLSANELKVSQDLRNSYWIYRVLCIQSNPQIIPIQDPFKYLESNEWQKRPINFVVTCSNKKSY